MMDGLGVGYDVLKQANPRLIYASGTGFGISGPDRDNLAMDFTIQAASGIMSVTGDPNGPPMKAGPTLVDFMGGIHLYAGVVTALFQRTLTGEGQLVEVAMQETVYPTLASSYDYYRRTGKAPPRAGNRQAGLASAPYNAFRTTDGHVAIHVVTEEHWPNLLRAMGREDFDGRSSVQIASGTRGAHGGDRGGGNGLDFYAHEDRGGGDFEAVPGAMRTGAQCDRGYERCRHMHERGMAAARRASVVGGCRFCPIRRCGCMGRTASRRCQVRRWGNTIGRFMASGWGWAMTGWRGCRVRG